jgi:hypothetical protein
LNLAPTEAELARNQPIARIDVIGNRRVSKDEYLKRMDTLVQRVHAAPTAEGFDEVIMPGETERRAMGCATQTRVTVRPPIPPGRRDLIPRPSFDANKRREPQARMSRPQSKSFNHHVMRELALTAIASQNQTDAHCARPQFLARLAVKDVPLDAVEIPPEFSVPETMWSFQHTGEPP